LERRFPTPQLQALVRRSDLDINNFAIVAVGANSLLGRHCVLRDNAAEDSPRSITIGDGCWIGPRVEFVVWDGHHICLKSDTTVNEGTKIYGSVTIEKYCLLAPNVFISSGNHHARYLPSLLIKDQDRLFQRSDLAHEHSKAIHIEEDCWIGMGVFVRQGVYIGRGAVIGANSVVLKDVPPYSVQVGAPSRQVEPRLDFQPPDELRADSQEARPYFYRGFRHRLEEVTESLRSGVILGETYTAVTLKRRPCRRVRLKGRLSCGITSMRLRVRLNGQGSADVPIAANLFELEVEIPSRVYPSVAAPTMVPAPLRSFNYFTFDVVDMVKARGSSECPSTPYGLSVVQQLA
jgi:acetyltransferase-like isoleucine patch superfamily enzyme